MAHQEKPLYRPYMNSPDETIKTAALVCCSDCGEIKPADDEIAGDAGWRFDSIIPGSPPTWRCGGCRAGVAGGAGSTASAANVSR
jgi:hypothetical protein